MTDKKIELKIKRIKKRLEKALSADSPIARYIEQETGMKIVPFKFK